MRNQERRLSEQERRDAAKAKFESYEKVTNIFKATPAQTKQSVWDRLVRPQTIDTFGFDPGAFSESKTGNLDAMGKLIENGRKGTMPWETVFTLAGELRTQMEKDESQQAGDILKDLPNFKSTVDKPKTMSPEDAAKRWTELQMDLTKVGKLTDIQSMMIQSSPELAKDPNFMKTYTYKPEEISRLQGAALNEMRTIAPYLPPERRPRFVTQSEYDRVKQTLSQKKGREISDPELYSIMIPVDANAGQ